MRQPLMSHTQNARRRPSSTQPHEAPCSSTSFTTTFRATVPVKFKVLATALQLAVLALIFIWARAPRLGPARPTPVTTHRSSLEYVHAMGSLIANANIDAEVVTQLRADLRRVAHERAGIALNLSHEEWAREAAKAAELPLQAIQRVFETDEVLAVARAAAQVELKLLR